MKKSYLYIWMLLIAFCAVSTHLKAQDVGSEDEFIDNGSDFGGGDGNGNVIATTNPNGSSTYTFGDGSTLTLSPTGGYVGSTGLTLINNTPAPTYPPDGMPSGTVYVQDNATLLVDNPNGSLIQYDYTLGDNGYVLNNVEIIQSGTQAQPTPPPGTAPVSSNYNSSNNYVITPNGVNYTLTFTDGTSLTVNPDNTITVNSGMGDCNACTASQAALDLPYTIPVPQLPPNYTQAELTQYLIAIGVYSTVIQGYHAACPAGQYKDSCGQCVGGSSGRTACTKDCLGVWGGLTVKDSCGACVGGNTGKVACKKDCNNVWGGRAAKDSCGVCTGGTTGKTACNKIPCATDSTFTLTSAMLKSINTDGTAANRDSVTKYLNLYMRDKDFNINTRLRLAHFLAQIITETDGFRGFVEETYTAKNILDGFPGKFDTTTAKTYANCLCLFDKVYCCRNGNGDEASKDGSKYRGQGIIQLTFKEEYQKFTTYYQNKFNDKTVDFVQNPGMLATNMKYSVLSALWEACVLKKLNPVADKDDVLGYSRGINGAIKGVPNGFKNRKDNLAAAKKLLCL